MTATSYNINFNKKSLNLIRLIAAMQAKLAFSMTLLQ